MDQRLLTPPRSPAVHVGRAFIWLSWIVCYGFLFSVIGSVTHQIVVHPRAQRIILLRTIPLPAGLKAVGAPDSLEPGVAQFFDQFGQQDIDPTTHLLFIAHTGPIPNNYDDVDHTFHSDNPADIARDGNVLVYNLQKQKLVGRVPVPRATGLLVVPKLHKVFVSGSEQNRVYSFDEPSLTHLQYFQFPDNTDPATLGYDPVHRRLFVAVPGAEDHATVKVPGQLPIQNENIDPQTESVYTLDALTLKMLARISIGSLPKLPNEDLSAGEDTPVPTVNGDVPKFGYRIDQLQYDNVTHLVYVLIEVSENRNMRPHPNPPLGAAELVTIDPATVRIIRRTTLPPSCNLVHSLVLDTAQQIAYIDCTSVDTDPPLIQHIARMNLKTMKAFPDNPLDSELAPAPFMMALDRPLHLLFEACDGGIVVFDVRPGIFHKLGVYVVATKLTSIIVDEATQLIYLPVVSAGGRPTLYIAQYNPYGV